MLEMSSIQREIFTKRYAITNDETWEECAKRVAASIAQAEKNGGVSEWSKIFNDIIADGDFIPGGRILFGAGRGNYNMLNCYRLHPEDSVSSIAECIKDTYLISCAGGGIGFNFSDIRPKGDDIQNIRWAAPGSVSNMRMINEIGNHVKAGKNRRTALIAILNVTHPDLLEFLHVKLDLNELNNFNISVGITNKFIDAVKNNEEWVFTFNGRNYYYYSAERVSKDGTRETIHLTALNDSDAKGRCETNRRKDQNDRFENIKKEKLPAKKIWDDIMAHSWKCGDPGIYNIDLANSYTNVSYFESLDAPNPSLRFDTKVLTDSGVYDIGWLAENKPNPKVKNFKGEWHDCKVFKSGENKQLYKITFSNGEQVFCTPEHKWPLLKSNTNYKRDGVDKIDYTSFTKKPTTELKAKDLIYLPLTDNPIDNKESKWTREDGFVSGWNLGDGWKTYHITNKCWQYGFIFSPEDQSFGCADRIHEYVNKLTKREVNLRENKGCKELVSTDSKFVEHMESFGLTHKSVGIPSGVWSASKEYVFGFVDGLFSTDGSVDPKEVKISLKSAHSRLIRDVQRLLSFYGLNCHVHKEIAIPTFPNEYGTGKSYTSYTLALTGINAIRFSKIFKLTNENKQAKLNIIQESPEPKIVNGRHYKRIKSVELTDIYEDVYDITVFDDTHTFMTEVGITGNCGEIPLPPYGNCCLGHVNLSNMYDSLKNDVNWDKLANTVRAGIRFLDNVLTMNSYPIPECKTVGERSRRIGLGVTGLHYLLIKLGYRYGSKKSIQFMDRLFATFRNEAYLSSISLAKEKGSFSAFDAEKYCSSAFVKQLPAVIQRSIAKNGIRNAVMLTIAPCGTNSMVLGVSSGVEPIFAPVYERSYRDGNIWKKELLADKLFSEYFINGKDTTAFIGAHDISVEDHIAVQATIQKYIDSAISKTTNIPQDYPVDKLSDIVLEYAPFVKGFTIYRTNSRGLEPLKPVVPTPEVLEEICGQAVESNEYCKGGVCEI